MFKSDQDVLPISQYKDQEDPDIYKEWPDSEPEDGDESVDLFSDLLIDGVYQPNNEVLPTSLFHPPCTSRLSMLTPTTFTSTSPESGPFPSDSSTPSRNATITTPTDSNKSTPATTNQTPSSTNHERASPSTQNDTNLQEAYQKISEQREEIGRLMQCNAVLQSQLKSANKKGKKLSDIVSPFATGKMEQRTTKLMEHLATFASSHRGRKRVSNAAINVLFSETFMNGVFRSSLLDTFTKYVRKEIFTPEACLKCADEHISVNLEAFEAIRSIQTKGKKYFRTALLPCSADIKRSAAILNAYADDFLPAEYGKHDGKHDFVRFNPTDVIKKTLTAFGVPPSNQRKVQFSQAIDGTNFTKNLKAMVHGFKQNDKAAKCPRSGAPLFANSDKDTIQSRGNCFFLQTGFMTETKDAYQYFKKDIKDLDAEAERLNCKVGKDCDMSAQWKGLSKGGAMGRDIYACHCCARHRDTMHLPNDECCDRCFQIHGGDIPAETRCYHDDFLTDGRVEELEADLDDLENAMEDLIKVQDDDLSARSLVGKLKLKWESPSVQVTDEMKRDIQSIHFDLGNATTNQKRQYLRYLLVDLNVRKLNAVDGTMQEKQTRLKEALESEWQYISLRNKITHGKKGKETAIFLLLDCIPCILHVRTVIVLFQINYCQ
jgi:hypothetical protein